jgi:hypothetical protein
MMRKDWVIIAVVMRIIPLLHLDVVQIHLIDLESTQITLFLTDKSLNRYLELCVCLNEFLFDLSDSFQFVSDLLLFLD